MYKNIKLRDWSVDLLESWIGNKEKKNVTFHQYHFLSLFFQFYFLQSLKKYSM
jgi:hypothetical protein